MRTMPAVAVALRRRSAPTAGLVTISVGLAFYQLTSLALGPAGQRELQLSFDIPAVDVEQLSQPVIDRVDLVLGTLAPLMTTRSAPQPAGPSLARPPAISSEPSPATLIVAARPPIGVAAGPRATDYHDADARSLRLARRR
jgi:hypothetical protein